jgi:hypothetical protein
MLIFLSRQGRFASIGDGPARMAYQGALIAQIKDSKHWNFVGNARYYTLDFSIPSEYTTTAPLIEYKTDGALTALLLIHLLVEPIPVSPFLIYAAASHYWLLQDLPLDFLMAMIPDHATRQVITVIHGFQSTDTVSLNELATHPVSSRADLLGLTVRWFLIESNVT